MGRNHNSKGRSKSGPPFVNLPWFMFDCPAWQSLKPQEVVVYLAVARLYKGTNNGTLALSSRDAATRCKISRNTVAKVFSKLMAKGFLECVTLGAFDRKVRHATEWRLTVWRCDKTGAPPSKAFMKWCPDTSQKEKTRAHMSARRVSDLSQSYLEQAENTAQWLKQGAREADNLEIAGSY